MESRELDLAYCAGILDSEGCICVSPYAAKNHAHKMRYHNDLWVGMQNKAAIEFFQRTVGTGTVNRRKDVWVYAAGGPRAVHVLRLLLPYMIVKREQAEVFLDFQKTFYTRTAEGKPREGYRLTEEQFLTRKALAERITELNKRDSLAFHKNGVNSVELSNGDNTEPSMPNGAAVGMKAYRLAGEEPTNKPATSAPPEREEIVGAA